LSDQEYQPPAEIVTPEPAYEPPSPHVKPGTEIEFPLPERPDGKRRYGSDPDGLRDASKEILKDRPTEPASPTDRSWQYYGGDKAGQKLEPGVELTAEQGADGLKVIRDYEASIQQPNLAEGVDQFRAAVAEAQQPKPAEQPAEQQQPQDPNEVIRQALEHPAIRAAVEQEIAGAEQARATYAQAARQSAQMAAAALLSQHPELASLSAQELPHAINAIRSVNPQKATEIEAQLNRAKSLYDASVQAQQAQQQIQAQRLQEWAAQQDAVFEREVASKETPERMQKITENVVELAQEYGVSREELFSAWQSQPILRSAAFQRMMVDAAKYRMAQKEVVNKIDRSAPPVQRPGVSQPRDPNGDAIQGALSKFRSDPSPQNAAKLLLARRNSR
jgi:hypothetical protein